jgi:hypothetical protein
MAMDLVDGAVLLLMMLLALVLGLHFVIWAIDRWMRALLLLIPLAAAPALAQLKRIEGFQLAAR